MIDKINSLPNATTSQLKYSKYFIYLVIVKINKL